MTMNTQQQYDLEHAGTCNQVAACFFPDAAKLTPAFYESVHDSLTEFPRLELLDLVDDFWVITLQNAVFVTNENQFRQYNAKSGIYEPVTESTIIGQITTTLNMLAKHFPSRLKFDSFLPLKNRQRLKAVVERARDLLEVDQRYFKDQDCRYLNLANGIFNIDAQTFGEFNSQHPICEKMQVKYDPDAKCDVFLGGFLKRILGSEDIDLLQRYCGQLLQGVNYSQKILILTGDSGWGKSSLMKILGKIIGWNRVGIIREQLYQDEYELGHYQGKHLLYHPDMPTQFLNQKNSSIFKQLVGGDPLWVETKGSDERKIIEGNFPVILACNGKPQICIDQDTDAWARRLIVLSFKKPASDWHLGKLAELIVGREQSGILNWMLEGRQKLVNARLQLLQTPDQQTRASVLLLGSESPQAFVRGCLIKKKDAAMGVVELYENYQKWCRKHQLQSFTTKEFTQIAKTEIEMAHGLKYRHDLKGGTEGWMRGWKGLALVEAGETTDVKSESEGSA